MDNKLQNAQAADDVDNLIARYFFSNCMVSLYPETMVVVGRRHIRRGPFDIVEQHPFHIQEDTASRFFDFVDTEGRVPSPSEFLNL